MNLKECLIKTGLTGSEAELYMELCREGELTGYEAAKNTGIPRANAYQALAGLVDKGAAYVIEGNVPRYTAAPAAEYCKNIMSLMHEITEKIINDCPKPRKTAEPYVTITGFRHIVNKAKNIIDSASERVYVSASDQEFTYLKKELEMAAVRGLKVVAIVSGNINIDGAVVRRSSRESGQVRLIADSAHVLTGDITGSEDDACLYSQNRPLVQLIKDSLKNEIKLAEFERGNI